MKNFKAVALSLLALIALCALLFQFNSSMRSRHDDSNEAKHSPAQLPSSQQSDAAEDIPRIFSKPGIPSPLKEVVRGENNQRQFATPISKQLPDLIEHSSPAIMAMVPADGRLELLPEEIDKHTLHSRRMVLDTNALERVINGETNHLLAPTTTTEVLDLKISSIKTRSENTHTLLGKIVGEEEFSDVLVVYHDGIIHGSVARYDKNQHFEYRILPDGHMMVRELDSTTMTDVCGDPGVEDKSTCNHDHHGDASQEQPGGGEEPLATEGGAAAETINSTTVDLVVGYGREARIADGGISQIEARIITSVDRMSTAFVNSQVTDSEVMLLGTIEDPSYVYPGGTAGSMSSGDELGNLNNTTDGVLDAVSDYANLLGADLKSLVIKDADGSAGIAYKPGSSSVTARTYMTSTRITFAHELGHNLGCDHSWGDSNQTYYSRYGWRFKTTTGQEFRTIMAYDWGWGVRIPHYANPNVTYGGTPTGAEDGADVTGIASVDQRYVTGGLGYNGSDPNKAGFDGSNPALGARNAQMLLTQSGSNGVQYASNRSTRAGLSVISPAGDTWIAGSTQFVSFTGGDMDYTATVELYKGGVFQSTIATGNAATDRNISWTIPTGTSGGSDYQVRVTLTHPTNGSQSIDSSTFSITNSNTITLSSPTGGETWFLGESAPISWISGLGGNVKIELLKGGSLNSVISSSTANDGSFQWTVPSNQTIGTNYKVRVTSLSNPSQSDTSAINFEIAALPTLAGALDTNGLTWTTTGTYPWFPQTVTTHDGSDAAESADIADNQTSSMETTLSGPGTLTFWWKVSSETTSVQLRARFGLVSRYPPRDSVKLQVLRI